MSNMQKQVLPSVGAGLQILATDPAPLVCEALANRLAEASHFTCGTDRRTRYPKPLQDQRCGEWTIRRTRRREKAA